MNRIDPRGRAGEEEQASLSERLLQMFRMIKRPLLNLEAVEVCTDLAVIWESEHPQYPPEMVLAFYEYCMTVVMGEFEDW
jgi:hypothetical protein